MKKALSLILALVLCLSLCACGSNNSQIEERISSLEKEIEMLKSGANTTQDAQKNCPTEYVGEWKMKDIAGDINVLKLNADGTGSFDGGYSTDVIWEYNEKYNTIEFEFSYLNSTGSFAIREKDGKIVLDDTIVFFGKDFYRSVDFVE